MANLKYGSSGSDVKKMQEALIAAGYDVGATGADGVFGKNTQKAVQAYQKANGLTVDGIAGKNTLGSLYGSSSTGTNTSKTSATTTTTNTAKTTAGTPATTTATPTTAQATATPAATAAPVTSPAGFTYGDFSYADFAPSEVVQQANTLIQQHQANKLGDYTPVWQDEADAYLSQYQNRDPFSYDFNTDALYQQYKDNYIRQGQMAMMDTMGQAAAMTGGYGNSYAQTVGQQAYNQQLSQLNNILPELWQMANDRYTQEGQNLLAMYDLYMDREAQEYSKYQDNLSNWYQEMARLQDNYNTLYNREYDDYLDKKQTAYDEYQTDRSEEWEKYLANQEKEQAAAELMAGAGNYDRLADVYGLSDSEVSSLKAAAAAQTVKTTGGNGGKVEDKYKTLTWDEKQKLIKIFGGAESTAQLGQLAGIYGDGYDPDDIDELMRYANPDLYYQEPEEPEDTDTNGLFAQHQANNRLKGGGGGLKNTLIHRLTY